MKKKYINQLIKVCNELVNKFADKTGAFDIDFNENMYVILQDIFKKEYGQRCLK